MIKLSFKNRVIENASWLVAGKVAQACISLVINMLTARYLGPSNYGIISYAASIVAFASPLMNLGFNNVLVQEQIEHPESTGKIYGSSILLSLFSSIACIIGIATYTLIADFGQWETNIVVILYSSLLIFQAFELISYWFQAKLLSKYVAIVSLLAYFIIAIYKIILLVTNAQIEYFAVSNAFDCLLIVIGLFIVYKKKDGQKLTFSLIVAKRIFNNSKHYIISGLMTTIFAQTDRIMLKFMIGESSVGFYSAAFTCAGMTSFIFSALIDSFRPNILYHKRLEDQKGFENRIILLYSIVIYLSLAQSIFMTIFAKYIVYILYGSAYISTISILQIIVWYTTFSYIGSVRNIWILGEYKHKYLWILNLGGAITNIILNYVLIPRYGANGAAFASLITQFFTNVIMNAIVWPLKYNNILLIKSLNLIRVIKNL